jgi:3-oxoacyl-[acyl-carrier-protein] synthase-3
VKACIEAIEYALPERRVSNDDLARAHPDWDMEALAHHTGVLERRICAPDETAVDLGVTAAEGLLERTGTVPLSIGALVVCSQSPDHLITPNSCILQHRLDLPTGIPAFDFNHACSGYVYGLFLAKSLIQSGAADPVLFVTADSYSRFVYPGDRSTVTLFGDGATATLIRGADDGDAGIGEFVLGTDGGGAATFMIEAGGARVPSSEETGQPFVDRGGSVTTRDHVRMDGLKVLAFARKRVPSAVRELLAKTNLTMDDLDLVVLHQASAISLDYLEKWLDVPEEKRFRNVSQVGNTISSSIPIALRDAERAGRLKPGMRVLLVGYGAGLSWGACVVDW